MDGCIKFALLTGVTKFGKVSVFSDLNNLDDISMRNQYIDICGVSEQEIHDNLEAELHDFADIRGVTYDKLCSELRERYDGYHFTHNSIGIYNPFSLLNAFKYKEFGSYWFETGTPTYLVELLKKHHYDLERMAHEETDAQVLNSIDSESTNPIPVIYQSGYLTIKGYDEEFGIYRLGFPNREVEEGFIRFLLPYYASVNKVESPFEIQKFVREIRSGDYDSFFRRLQSFFADTTYEVIRDQELHYENVLFIVFKLVGFYTKVEYHTSEGRIDLVLQTDKFIYIMEFKLNGTAEEALQQITDEQIIAALGIGIVSYKDLPAPEIEAPDVVYRVDTDVITSITLNSKRRLTPSSPGKVTFYIKDRTYRVTNIVMPSYSSQVVWVKWHTPSTPQDIRIRVSVSSGNTSETEFIGPVPVPRR